MWECDNLEDLISWYLNFYQRLEIVEKLGCQNKDLKRHHCWTCCPAHVHLLQEQLMLDHAADWIVIRKGLAELVKDTVVLSGLWWRKLGRGDVPAAIESIRSAKNKESCQ